MLFLHLFFPKGNGIVDPAFGAGSSPKPKAVTQTGIHMKLRIDTGLLHGAHISKGSSRIADGKLLARGSLKEKQSCIFFGRVSRLFLVGVDVIEDGLAIL